MQRVTGPWEVKLLVWQFLKEVNTELPYDSAVVLLGLSRRMESRDSNIIVSVFIATLFTLANRYKQPKCPSAE